MKENKTPASNKNNYKKNAGTKAKETKPTKEVKVVEVKEEFNEDENKKLVVIVAVAILVIVATIICLLVGCNRANEEEEKEEKKEDTIVEPIKDDSSKEEEKSTTAKVVNVVAENTQTEREYEISYYYGESTDDLEAYVIKKKEGSRISKYLPDGFTNCTYYSDKEFTKEFDFNNKLYSDTKVYMVCQLERYTVTYKDSEGNNILSEEVVGLDTENYTVFASKENMCDSESFLGWSKNANMVISYKNGKVVTLNSDLTLTVVCGSASIVYKNVVNNESATTQEEPVETEEALQETENEVIDEENMVEIALTQEEVESYTLPETPEEVGLATPVYYVPVTEEVESENNYKTIVDDEYEELDELIQVKLSDVLNNKPDWYDPKVNDVVEEKPYEFKGWTTPVENEETGEIENVPVDEFTPDTEEGATNELDANWEIPVEDAVENIEI